MINELGTINLIITWVTLSLENNFENNVFLLCILYQTDLNLTEDLIIIFIFVRFD